jgi:outer membrane protein assembly factor BamE (lipoprotein component of BamABCDE complex)
MNSLVSRLVGVAGIILALGACASSPALQSGRYDPNGGRLAQIQPGLTQQEVRGLIGRPENVTGDSRSGETEWIYSFTDTWGYRSEFDVTFDARGQVESTYAERLED